MNMQRANAIADAIERELAKDSRLKVRRGSDEGPDEVPHPAVFVEVPTDGGSNSVKVTVDVTVDDDNVFVDAVDSFDNESVGDVFVPVSTSDKEIVKKIVGVVSGIGDLS